MEQGQPSADSAVRSRPQREIQLPASLANFEVGYTPRVTVLTSTEAGELGAAAPAHDIPIPDPLSLPSVRAESCRSWVSSHHSRPRSRSSAASSTKRSIADGLSELQSAILEEQVKRMELAEVQRQIMEQTLVDEQCNLLDKEAKDALYEKEELLREQERERRRLEEKAEMAYKSKEAITRHQMLRR
ncbi:hypothetical protein DPX16_17780 [Anabarilius grahami]|uniref:Uncharacterized protein n=1 Tax=Anabarilius grahami TaxID=495550 RepID=A0A3N0YHS9_ANAGA|nr:hypothetical protein DPX16_17780 [Anabarilius grahami]